MFGHFFAVFCSYTSHVPLWPGGASCLNFFLGARDGKGNDYLTWENVSSFGPVPPELKQAGDSACRAVSDELRAIGYHPEARGRDGIEITGGGFFCQPVIFGAN